MTAEARCVAAGVRMLRYLGVTDMDLPNTYGQNLSTTGKFCGYPITIYVAPCMRYTFIYVHTNLTAPFLSLVLSNKTGWVDDLKDSVVLTIKDI